MDRHLLVIGSYNGQDSLGDKYLLRCVSDQLRRAGGKAPIVSHVHDLPDRDAGRFPFASLTTGLSPLFWKWMSRLRYTALPPSWRAALLSKTYGLFFPLDASYRRIVSDIRNARLLYFYGGTQLCWKWYDFNYPPLFVTLRLLKRYGVPVFFGPQQYGPLETRQIASLKGLFRETAGVRTRNRECARLLGLPAEKVLHDEIFSNTELYPVRAERSREDGYILLNIRGGEFVDRGEDRIGPFLALLLAIQERTGASYRFFSMSGSSFCDDDEACRWMKEKAPSLRVGPPVAFQTEEEFFEIARQARGAVSMSFHGCVLSLIAGCPPVPVTETGYYDHKYADFDRYTGHSDTPVLSLRIDDAEREADRVIRYWKEYQVRKTADERQAAGARIKAWYAEVLSFSNDRRK